MKISFILPAHNEADFIASTIKAIHTSAAGLEYEIVVADDASTDRTREIAGELGATVVRHERRQIAATRNLGAAAAQGGYLFFIDADTRPSLATVGEAVESLKAGAAGGGAPIHFDEPIPLYARLIQPPTSVLFRLFRLTGGCFFFCTRAAFQASGGWDESLYASEEIALAKLIKRNGSFVIVRSPVLTSGRKLRTFTASQLVATLWRAVFTRGRSLQTRDNLELRYGERPPDRPRDGR
ncbi:MAG: glycosyltransferase [Phycisphaerales bacterium]